MSEEQLTALLAKLKADTGLQEKLKGAADLDAAVALAKAAGFDVTNEDFLNFRTTQTVELSDEDLENVSGGATPTVLPVVALVGAAFGLMEGGR
jgi:predicted ribosomally synthesized peptide with nif11-like leader